MSNQLAEATHTSRRHRLAVYAVGGLLVLGFGVWLGVYILGQPSELEAAEEALRRHDASAARTHLDRVLDRRPDDERALLLAARAARRADAHGDAERYLTVWGERSGAPVPNQLEWTLLGVQQGDFDGDEERLRAEVRRNHPDALAILEALAKGYIASYRWSDALEALGQLLEREPTHVPGLVLRSAISERFRRADSAEEDLRKAVAAAPDNALAQAALGELLSRHGHTREAIYHYELALRIQPAHPATRLGLARALADDANLTGAEQQLDDLLAADSNHADGLVERGRVSLRRKQFAEAKPFLDRATRIAPWHRDGHQLHLVALKELGRSGEAAKCEARLAELALEDANGGRLKLRARDNPGAVGVRMELWEWSVRNGQTEEGIAWLTEILRADPRHARAHTALADYFDRAGQPRRAAQHRAVAEGK